MHSFLKVAFVFSAFFVVCQCGFGQDLMRNANLSQIKIDQISDADFLKYQQRLKSSGLTAEQAIQLAVSRGLPAREAEKLRQRLSMMGGTAARTGSSRQSGDTAGMGLDTDSTDSVKADLPRNPLIDPRIFGSELFNNASLTFEPNLKIATPLNYEVGPGDELEVAVYGIQEVNHNLRVSNEGFIYVPNVGQVRVAGLTIEAATQVIKNRMGNTVYPSLRSGGSKASVNLAGIRSIRITVIGSNKPGNYTISSLSTVFNALFVCGGPSPVGSFREIELIRNNKLYKKIDLYRFLVNGDQTDNVGLRDNDVIRIPSYKTRVEIKGYVKRPGIFEILHGETFKNLLEYSSGFADSAYRASVKVTQFTDRELKVKDISSNDFAGYQPQAGDQYEVDKILNRFANRVNITGAVFRPGTYELTQGLTVGELIRKADGLKEDAYTARGQIIRLRDDLSKEIVSFDARTTVTGANVIPLRREDSIIIKSIFDLKDEYFVSVQGEIRSPGTYEYSQNLSLKDALVQAGGLTDAAYPQRIEVARLIRRDSLTRQDIRASDIIEISGMEDLSSPQKNLQLQPFDVVSVRRKPGYLTLQSVRVTGELQYPGPYVLAKREERVSDLIARAGGFSPEAFKEGAYLKRYDRDEERKKLKRLQAEKIQEGLKDSTDDVEEDLVREFDQIPLDIAKIMANPGSLEDVVLQAGDEFHVPKFNAQVRINGSVLFPTQIPYNEKYSFKDYLSSAGGVADNGRKRKSYILYANGKAASVRNFLFFKTYPRVMPGSEIIVPKKAERQGIRPGEAIGLASALASLAGVVIAILNLSK
ncbi:SLBB domain-containing protein [Foetidibacter luteolus]|uniref:SLBB domain-containing protein n=1 Tax=Foetidibacter luteolus TaxID=2608880 RepID=UPI00129B4818|nr:SLBB domain-containing protein [Foetidibacter luteolus]